MRFIATHWWICLFLASAAAAQQTASLEGRVIDAVTGEPIRKAQVSLSSAAKPDSELVATTDEAGQFRFADVPPGVYQLGADKTGFFGGGYGEVEPEDIPTLLTIHASDKIHDIALRLFPAGTMSGRVLDADGDPAPRYEVMLWTRKRHLKSEPVTVADETTANQSGEYRFEGIMPGTYYVSANPENPEGDAHRVFVDSEGKVTNNRPLRTFYPAALSQSAGQAIVIESGQEQPGIDIQIQRGKLLTVKGKIAGIMGPVSRYEVSAASKVSTEGGAILPDGEFIFDALQPGKYRLLLFEHDSSGGKQIGETEIALTDQDVSGVVIAPFKPAQVRVHVVLEEEDKPLTRGSVFLIPEGSDGNLSGSPIYTPQNGIYQSDNIRPGKYRVHFNNASGCYLKSIQSSGRTLDSQIVDIAEGASLDLLLIYSKNVASVSGDVEVPRDQPKHSIRVILIAQDSALLPIRPAQLDQSLHFFMDHLPPGKYLAFATQESDFDLWEDADFVKLLEPEGTAVELHENEHASLRLKLIPRDVTTRLRQKLGL